MERIGNRLKSLREKRQMSVDDVAKALGFAKSVVWGYESAKKQVSVSHLELFADYYDVSVDYLLERNQKANTLDLLQLPLSNSIKVVVDDQLVNKEELAEVTSYLQIKRRLQEESM